MIVKSQLSWETRNHNIGRILDPVGDDSPHGIELAVNFEYNLESCSSYDFILSNK